MAETTAGLTPAPGKMDAESVYLHAVKTLGPDYEDLFVFTVTFAHLREVDRHLRDLNGMRRDLEWLQARLREADLGTEAQRAHRPVWSAMVAWLEEETRRHNSAIMQLRAAISNAQNSHPKAAAAAEQYARPTFGAWLELAPTHQ